MTDTIDKVAFAAAELIAASDALASAAAEVDALRAEVARQTGIAVDHCARADAAEQMVVELRERLREAGNELVGVNDETAGVLGDVDVIERVQTALASAADVAGRWVPVGVAAGIAKRCDAAIAARDEAVAGLDVYEQRIREIADDVFGVQDAHAASVLLLDAIECQCHRDRIDRLAAERARDEVGIQLAAAQERIKLLEKVAKEARAVLEDHDRSMIHLDDAVSALDAVQGDALAPTFTAALEASGIDSNNVKGVE